VSAMRRCGLQHVPSCCGGSWFGPGRAAASRDIHTAAHSGLGVRDRNVRPCADWQGGMMLADVTTNNFPNAHVARWEHPPNPGHTGYVHTEFSHKQQCPGCYRCHARRPSCHFHCSALTPGCTLSDVGDGTWGGTNPAMPWDWKGGKIDSGVCNHPHGPQCLPAGVARLRHQHLLDMHCVGRFGHVQRGRSCWALPGRNPCGMDDKGLRGSETNFLCGGCGRGSGCWRELNTR
jgi:hypothetical protein